ncbi:MAG: helix-turn-helix domain-containing protein [Armatimonadota bacterium]
MTDHHAHPYYEGVVILDGSVDLATSTGTQRLKAGHTVLFSPQVAHQWQTHDDACLCMVFSFDVKFPLALPPRQRWPRCPELLWTLWLFGEAIRSEHPDWAWRAHCFLGVIYTALLDTLTPPTHKAPEVPRIPQIAMRVDDLVRADLAHPPSLEAIAAQLSMSVRHLTRQYRVLTGMTIHERLESFRLERAAHLLLTTNLSVADIGQAVGLTCASYFTRRFRQRFDVPPCQYRRLEQSPVRSS